MFPFVNPAVRELIYAKKRYYTLTRIIPYISSGGRWIRTIEVSDNRFTVCPLWPLGNSPLFD